MSLVRDGLKSGKTREAVNHWILRDVNMLFEGVQHQVTKLAWL